MRSSWFPLCLGCLLLVAVGVAGWIRLNDRATAPMAPPLPGQPAATGGPVADAPPAAASEPGADADPLPERALASAAGDVLPADAAVRVVEVLGDAERPLAGVEVSLRGGRVAAEARTGRDGVASFRVLGGDGQVVRASCGLGAAAEFRLAAASPAQIDLRIQPRLRVAGHVHDASGQPIADAAIVLLPWADRDEPPPPPLRIARSDANGRFEAGLAAGGHLGAHHRLFGSSAMYPVVVPAAEPHPLPPKTLTLALLLLGAPGQIAGTVRDHRGAGIAGAELEFRNVDPPPPGAGLRACPQRVRTDAAGRFVATRLAGGGIAYGVRARGHGPSSGTLVLGVGESARLDVALPAACQVAGMVLDPEGRPASAIVVAGSPDAFTSVRTTTGIDGTFLLDDVPCGTVPLLAMAAGPQANVHLRAQTVVDLAPGSRHEWTAELRDARQQPDLRGLLVDATGKPLVGWTVVARPSQSPGPFATARSDGDGRFGLRGTGGRVDLRAYAPGQPVRGFATAVLRGVDAGAGEVRFTVAPEPTGTITALVLTQHQQPLPASIACWHHERAEHVRFSARNDGTAQLADVPAGTLDLLFEHPGQASTSRRDVAVRANDTVDLGIVLLGEGGGLFGSVRGPDGAPPRECSLTVVADAQRFHATYGGGSYRFPTLPAGEYRLLVQAPGIAAAAFSITVEAGVDKQQDVELRAGVCRTLRVVVPPTAPASVALAIRAPGQPMEWLATAMAGRTTGGGEREVEFTAWMAPGTYEVVAWSAGGYEARTPVAFGPGDVGDVLLRLVRR